MSTNSGPKNCAICADGLQLATLDYEIKCWVLEMLNIKVWIDDYSVKITGTLPRPEGDIVTMQT